LLVTLPTLDFSTRMRKEHIMGDKSPKKDTKKPKKVKETTKK